MCFPFIKRRDQQPLVGLCFLPSFSFSFLLVCGILAVSVLCLCSTCPLFVKFAALSVWSIGSCRRLRTVEEFVPSSHCLLTPRLAVGCPFVLQTSRRRQHRRPLLSPTLPYKTCVCKYRSRSIKCGPHRRRCARGATHASHTCSLEAGAGRHEVASKDILWLFV